MTAKHFFIILIGFAVLSGCKPGARQADTLKKELNGTWKLVSSVNIKPDTTINNMAPGQEMIKIINPTHFAFLMHDIKKPGDTASAKNEMFVGGGGPYSIKNNKYIEHLEYCSARNYEGIEVSFDVEFKGDTLILTGIEEVKNEKNEKQSSKLIEKYVKMQ